MHGIELFTELSLLIVLVTIVSIIMKSFRQPLILGYILTGLIVGTVIPAIFGSYYEVDTKSFDIFSNLGIALLLFIIGLGLKMSVFRRLGGVVFTIALALLLILGGIGLFTMQAFGFSFIEAVIAGLALFFSSTIIIVKILSDKKESTRLHGQIAIGVILMDDLVATVALLLVAAGRNGFHIADLGILILKGALLIGALAFVASKILPKLSRQFASNQELLFLFTIAWGLGIATVFQWAGLSIEVGALFAGICLAPLPYTQEMESRLKPLRDFFIVIFFITLGAGLHVDNLVAGLVPALLLSAAVIILKPIVTIAVMNLFGYTKRTSFKTGINLSQISEFSIILVAVAAGAGVIGDELTAIITIVALITITISTYLMQYDNLLLQKLERRFRFFADYDGHNEKEALEQHDLILFGYKRGGHEFVRTFQKMKKPYVVIDYDPAMIETLERQHLPHMYGDATDAEFLRDAGIRNAKLVVSTITDFTTNQYLMRYVRRVNPTAVVITHADDHDEEAVLYRLGAAYVLLPHYIGSERINHFIRKRGTSRKSFNDYRKKHLYGLGKTALKS